MDPIRVDIYHHFPPPDAPVPEGMGAKLDRILRKLDNITELETQAMADLTAITQEVAENGSAVDSAVALLGSLSDQIRALSTDPAALQALADQLDADGTRLAEAVVANTPAEEPPPEG